MITRLVITGDVVNVERLRSQAAKSKGYGVKVGEDVIVLIIIANIEWAAICLLVSVLGVYQGAKVIQTFFDGVRHSTGRFRFVNVAGFIGRGEEFHDVEA